MTGLQELMRREVATSIDERIERYEVELPVAAQLLDGDDLERFAEVISAVSDIIEQRKARNVAAMERSTTERPTTAGKGLP